MKNALCKRIALLMLAIFIANISIAHIRTQWLQHEVEHALHDMPTNSDGHHLDDGDHDILNGAEHQLMHAVDHIQPLPSVQAATPHRLAMASLVVFSRLAFLIPESVFPAPFRPPRRVLT
ncbi:hypothetical protein [Herbaspirillum sp.]|nr:hypothetical protein [Herbaspirillum sp.]|tara:strand:+ start:664 stop:1023 length:360 start_codon:yes stop_codon:yes gene_type:complete